MVIIQELARENSQRDRENAFQSLRKTTTGSGINSPINTAGSSSMANSREGSHNASYESSVSERTSAVFNSDPSNTTLDKEKTQARVHSLIEEYTENYSELTDRPVKVNQTIVKEDF